MRNQPHKGAFGAAHHAAVAGLRTLFPICFAIGALLFLYPRLEQRTALGTGDRSAKAPRLLEKIRSLEKASQKNPGDPEILSRLAERYIEQGLGENGFNCYERLLSLEPDNPRHYQNYANALMSVTQSATNFLGCAHAEIADHYIDLHTTAIKLTPGDLSTARDYALTFQRIRPPRPAGAIEAWQHILTQVDDPWLSEEAKCQITRWLIELGRPQEAARQFESVGKHFQSSIYFATQARLKRELKKLGERGPVQADNPAEATALPEAQFLAAALDRDGVDPAVIQAREQRREWRRQRALAFRPPAIR